MWLKNAAGEVQPINYHPYKVITMQLIKKILSVTVCFPWFNSHSSGLNIYTIPFCEVPDWQTRLPHFRHEFLTNF
jgi:hypothetical protein